MEQNTKFDVSSISKIESSGSVKALASIVINNEIAVRGVKVVEGEKGLSVVMPSRKNGNEFSDVAFPVTKEAHDAIKSAVLSSYDKLMQSGEKTLKNDVPSAEQSTSTIKPSLHPVNGNPNVKAAGQVAINDCFVVQDIKVIVAEGKPPFVSMPSYQNSNGEYVPTALPITKDMHEKLDKAVLGTYQTLGKVEYQGVKYAELGNKEDVSQLSKQNNQFAKKLMSELDKAGIKYQARIADTTTISVNKADKPRLDAIKQLLVKALNPESQKQENKPPKHGKR